MTLTMCTKQKYLGQLQVLIHLLILQVASFMHNSICHCAGPNTELMTSNVCHLRRSALIGIFVLFGLILKVKLHNEQSENVTH